MSEKDPFFPAQKEPQTTQTNKQEKNPQHQQTKNLNQILSVQLHSVFQMIRNNIT